MIKIKDNNILYIKWDDDSTSEIELAHLRRFCPCAICTSEETHHHDYIKVYTAEQSIIKSINTVGSYAIGVVWGDNHNTGIYDFEYLKKISVMLKISKN